MEFVVFTETNYKERESYITYLQWTGNEVELKKLDEILKRADTSEMDGDVSVFDMSLTRVSERSVDEHIEVSRSTPSMSHLFSKKVGVFVCPDFDISPSLYASEQNESLAGALDDHFYGQRIDDYFTTSIHNPLIKPNYYTHETDLVKFVREKAEFLKKVQKEYTDVVARVDKYLAYLDEKEKEDLPSAYCDIAWEWCMYCGKYTIWGRRECKCAGI